MERDRKAVSEQSGGKLAKQKKVIKILRNEHKNIITNLDVATAPGKIQEDRTVVKNLTNLLNQFDDFDANIKAGKSHLNEINDQIRQVKKDVADLEAEQITDVQWQTRILEGQKIVDALENKLDVQIKKFCTIMSQNRKLREEIDHLLKERAHFNLLWEKLIGNLNQGKKFMLDLIEQATIAYDQREEWCSKLQALRTRAHNDLILHSEEIRELCGKIDKEEKLRDFLSIKCQKRIMADLEQKEMAKRIKQREAMEALLQQYRRMLDDIFTFTGKSEVDLLAEAFRKDEEENFALFKYINELNREMENLTDDLNHLHLEIDDQKQLNTRRAIQQEEKLKNMNNELDDATREADEAEAEMEAKDKKLAQLLAGINKLFKLCKCSNAPLLELLGNNSEINKYNVGLHLEILEKRITDLILMVYYRELGEVSGLLGILSLKQTYLICVVF